MKKIIFILLIFVSTFGCNQRDEQPNYFDMIEIHPSISSPLDINTELTAKVEVTQNGQLVSDVNEVVMEIWEHGKRETYQKLEGEKVSKGVYETKWSAEEEGVYYIYFHVTALGMHRMQKEQLVIGENVDVESILATPDENPGLFMNN